MFLTEDLKRQIWNKCQISPLYDKEKVRKDSCGAWILYTEFGNSSSPFGWEIDHICPISKLRKYGIDFEKIDNIINLRALNIKNNRSKGDSYPVYTSTTTAVNDERNHDIEETYVVNQVKQNELSKFFSLDND